MWGQGWDLAGEGKSFQVDKVTGKGVYEKAQCMRACQPEVDVWVLQWKEGTDFQKASDLHTGAVVGAGK